MILVAASKKLIKFDTKTFLSTINGGRKIADFPRKNEDACPGATRLMPFSTSTMER
jgi:hypothetical protein